MKHVVLFFFSFLLFSTGFAQNKPVVTFDVMTYDFGDILEADGNASYSFTVTNTGNAPLVISNVQASCGCTQPEWTKEPIAPGKTGYVKATYLVKDRIGPFSKSVTVSTNTDENSTLVIKGNVLKERPNTTETHPTAMGSLRLTKNSVNFYEIKKTETKTETIELLNDGKEPLTLSIGNTADGIKAVVSPTSLLPNRKGNIEISYHGADAKSLGINKSSIPLIINGEKNPENTISVTAKIVEDFSKMTAEQLQNAPRLNIVPLAFTFDGSKTASQTLKIANSGKTPLIISSLTANTDAIVISGGKKEVQQGEIVEFKVTLQPKKVKSGTDVLISIISNDPKDHQRELKVTIKK